MKNFYVLYIEPDAALKFRDEIKKQIDLATDWYRIKTGLWVLYTGKNAKTWSERIRNCIDNKTCFIARLDLSDRQGWMSGDFWEWIRKERDND